MAPPWPGDKVFASLPVKANAVYMLIQRFIFFTLSPWFQFAFVWLIVEGTQQICFEITLFSYDGRLEPVLLQLST